MTNEGQQLTWANRDWFADTHGPQINQLRLAQERYFRTGHSTKQTNKNDDQK